MGPNQEPLEHQQDETLANSEVDPGALVVFTAITGDYDSLKLQPESATRRTDLVAFVDGEKTDRKNRWECRSIERAFDDPARNAKIHKILPHRYFPDKTYSLWLDGSVAINFTMPAEQLVSMYLADCDVAVLRHSRRTCIYQEAQAVLHQRLDDPESIRSQIERYTREGYPANAGLAENCVILRRHTAGVQDFNEAWWKEIERGSRRDQLSFNYVAWKCGLRYRYFPTSIISRNGLFRRFAHNGQVQRPWIAEWGARRLSRACDRLLSPVVLPMAAALGRRELRASMKRTVRQALPSTPGATVNSEDVLVRRRSPSSLSGSRPVIAFGPERKSPSWEWVGYDSARELSKTSRMIVYDDMRSNPPECDVLFIVKSRPRPEFLVKARERGSRIVYCPVDIYQSPAEIDRDAGFLAACDMVLVHNERLLPLLGRHCPNTHFVEHHGRFTLPEMTDFKEDGFVLWVGGCQYMAHFLSWLQLHPIKNEVKILTDLDRMWKKRGARRYSSISLRLERRELAGCKLYRWSERKQLEMMRECKAAIDIKRLDDFNQYTKPPTKAQKFIASGIPFAANPGSYTEEYFRLRGFSVASPEDPDRWFSRSYWEETREFGRKLRESTSLEAVGRRYRELIESIL